MNTLKEEKTLCCAPERAHTVEKSIVFDQTSFDLLKTLYRLAAGFLS